MKFDIKPIPQLSGNRCKIYSIQIHGDNKTLFEQFLEENDTNFSLEVENIVTTLKLMGQKFGAKDQFFRPKKEGKLGDGVEALFDYPNANLRLYAIKYADGLLILGGGGQKSKNIKAFQEDPKLTMENYLLRKIAATLYKAILEKDLRWNKNGDDFEGQFHFDSENY
jgi:hypothetical protein